MRFNKECSAERTSVVFITALTIALVFMCSCSNSNNSVSATSRSPIESSVDNDGQANAQIEDEFDGPESQKISVDNANGVLLIDEDGLIKAQLSPSTNGSGEEMFGFNGRDEDDEPITLIKGADYEEVSLSSGDELVYGNFDYQSEITMIPILKHGFTQEDGMDTRAWGKGGWHGGYDEINGINVSGFSESDAEKAFTNGNCEYYTYGNGSSVEGLFLAGMKTSLPAGWYEKSEFVEGQIDLSTPCYLFEWTSETEHRAPVEKTKDGYFIIDTSSVNPGMYAFFVGSVHDGFYVIDIHDGDGSSKARGSYGTPDADSFIAKFESINSEMDTDPRLSGSNTEKSDALSEYSEKYELLMQDILGYLRTESEIVNPDDLESSQEQWNNDTANVFENVEAEFNEKYDDYDIDDLMCAVFETTLPKQQERISVLIGYLS